MLGLNIGTLKSCDKWLLLSGFLLELSWPGTEVAGQILSRIYIIYVQLGWPGSEII